MNIEETEIDGSFFQPAKRRVDQSIGFVLMGLVVFLFFSIFLIGILRVQNITQQPNSEPARSAAEPSPEIGTAESDSTTPGMK